MGSFTKLFTEFKSIQLSSLPRSAKIREIKCHVFFLTLDCIPKHCKQIVLNNEN